MPPPRKVPSNKGHFRFSSPVLRIESLLRNICRNTFLLSLYWYFLPVNYTSLDFFLIMVRCIFSLESSCLSPLILAGPCIQDSPALLFACLLLPLVQVSVRVPASVRPVLAPRYTRVADSASGHLSPPGSTLCSSLYIVLLQNCESRRVRTWFNFLL